jgi:ferritin-like metal-binding protein YciE
MAISTLNELIGYHLANIRDAEKQIAPLVETAAGLLDDEDLTALLRTRAQQGARLVQDVESLQKKYGGGGDVRNLAARGILDGVTTLMNEVTAPEMKEAVIVGGAQEIGHYCIAVWGTVKALAAEAGDDAMVSVMQTALDAGYELDQELTQLAEDRVNTEAAEASDDAEDEEA